MNLIHIADTHLGLAAASRLNPKSGMNLREKHCDETQEESDAADKEFGKSHSDKGLVVWEIGAGCQR